MRHGCIARCHIIGKNTSVSIQIEGYPTEGHPDFQESSVNHLVYTVISPILRNFIGITGHDCIQLRSAARKRLSPRQEGRRKLL